MSRKAFGKSHRTCISMAELSCRFPIDAVAAAWIFERRWLAPGARA